MQSESDDRPEVFKATPGQTAFVDDRSAETAYVGGVGSGKTAAGVIRARRQLTEWNVGSRGVIVAPTVPMLRSVVVPELRKWGLLDRPGVEYKRSENTIEYPNGSILILESANNDRKIERLRGLNLAWAWMDEAAYQPEKVYNVLSDRLRVGEYRNLFATTTPRGYNWVYDVFADALPDDPDVDLPDGGVYRSETTTAVLGVSTRANPANPEDYITRQERQRSGDSYRQEIEGEFVTFEGLVYQWFSDDHVVEPDAVPTDYDRAIYGVDWGGSAPTAIVCLLEAGGAWYLADEFYERRVVNETIVRELRRMQDRYGPGPVYCDTNEPRAIQQLRQEGYDAREADKAVETGIRYVNSVSDDLAVASHCQNVINEFNSYQYKDGGESDDVLKENDHAMDALRYALFTDSQQGERTVKRSGSMSDLM
jgi:PBSX family phage terminase large subunit